MVFGMQFALRSSSAYAARVGGSIRNRGVCLGNLFGAQNASRFIDTEAGRPPEPVEPRQSLVIATPAFSAALELALKRRALRRHYNS